MSESDPFWEFYWETRLQGMETLGKREAILCISRLIRALNSGGEPVRLLELGCGDAQIIGTLVEGHAQVPGISQSVGVDYVPAQVQKARQRYPGMRFIEGDFTDPALLESLGQFDVVLLVNALHEVFSAGYTEELGEVDTLPAKQRAEEALASAVGRVKNGGYLVLFDGLEPDVKPGETVRIRFADRQAREHFETFMREYRPFRIAARPVNAGGDSVELSWRDFTRYITKSIFLGKPLWLTERFESYQYFTEREFRAAFARLALPIRTLRTLTVNEEKWRRVVEIQTPGAEFPAEHILIVAQKESVGGNQEDR